MPTACRILTACAFVAAIAGASLAQAPEPALTLPCRVVSVHDGDTLTVELRLLVNVRLLDCWAPELKDKGGIEARDYLTELSHNKRAVLHVPLGDRGKLSDCLSFGRVLGDVWVNDCNLSAEMVRTKHATRTKQTH